MTIAPFPPTTLIRLYELLKNSRRPCSLIYWQMPISKHQSPDALILKSWWRMTGSNRRPPACKAGALPAELIPLRSLLEEMVGLVGLEPTTPALSRRCSNQLSYRPKSVNRGPCSCPDRWRHLPTTDKCGRLSLSCFSSRKEVIQPHLPIRLPCYDFTPVTNPAVVIAPLAVRLTTSGRTRSHGVTGGVYKTRERIHRDMLIHDY